MAFVKKTWVDRDSEYPNRRSLTNPTTGTTEVVDVGLAEGDVYTEGTPIKASEWNDLEQRIEDGINSVPQTEVEVTPAFDTGISLADIRVNDNTETIKMPQPYIVTIEDDEEVDYVADKTFNEIVEAATAGYDVRAVYYDATYMLVGIKSTSVEFADLTASAASHDYIKTEVFELTEHGNIVYKVLFIHNIPEARTQYAGRILGVSSAGKYILTTDNTILDTSTTNTKRPWSGKKVNDELTARDSVIALKANTSDVNTALATKADKATTYTKPEVDTALSAKANSADLATVATSGNYADLNGKPTIDTAMSDSSTNAVQNRVIKAYVDGQTTDVSVQQTLTEGTEIGGITVDGEQTKLYAPTQESEIDDTSTALDKTWSANKLNGLLILDVTNVGV